MWIFYIHLWITECTKNLELTWQHTSPAEVRCGDTMPSCFNSHIVNKLFCGMCHIFHICALYLVIWLFKNGPKHSAKCYLVCSKVQECTNGQHEIRCLETEAHIWNKVTYLFINENVMTQRVTGTNCVFSLWAMIQCSLIQCLHLRIEHKYCKWQELSFFFILIED